jgi:hypothetical protein
MGDSGEGLVDAEARIQERLDEREQEKKRRALKKTIDPERLRALESLRLARTELGGQLDRTTHPTRREQLAQALAELDRRIAAAVEGATA